MTNDEAFDKAVEIADEILRKGLDTGEISGRMELVRLIQPILERD